MAAAAKNIDEYIAQFPAEIQKGLKAIRAFIQAEAPGAVEKISYGMPAFYLAGNLVYFAAFKDHYGFFPTPSGIDKFEKELAPFKSGKGTLRFPLDKPLPWKLLKKVIQFRIKENMQKAANKKK